MKSEKPLISINFSIFNNQLVVYTKFANRHIDIDLLLLNIEKLLKTKKKLSKDIEFDL